jgi:hypothetical protein
VFKLIHQYSDIITAYKVSRFEHFGDILRIRAEFVLSDHSTLYVRETVLGPSMRKYAYHWQDREGNLIVRWDNAPDWEVKTFPHHKHIGQNNSVEASFERTLSQVFEVIRKRLCTVL